MSKILENQRGFSLIQTIISIGVMAAATMAMMTLMVNQQRQMRYLETKMALGEEIIFLKNKLAKPGNCQATLNSIKKTKGVFTGGTSGFLRIN